MQVSGRRLQGSRNVFSSKGPPRPFRLPAFRVRRPRSTPTRILFFAPYPTAAAPFPDRLPAPGSWTVEQPSRRAGPDYGRLRERRREVVTLGAAPQMPSAPCATAARAEGVRTRLPGCVHATVAGEPPLTLGQRGYSSASAPAGPGRSPTVCRRRRYVTSHKDLGNRGDVPEARGSPPRPVLRDKPPDARPASRRRGGTAAATLPTWPDGDTAAARLGQDVHWRRQDHGSPRCGPRPARYTTLSFRRRRPDPWGLEPIWTGLFRIPGSRLLCPQPEPSLRSPQCALVLPTRRRGEGQDLGWT